jgi:hypothetical protein
MDTGFSFVFGDISIPDYTGEIKLVLYTRQAQKDGSFLHRMTDVGRAIFTMRKQFASSKTLTWRGAQKIK